MKAHSRVGAEQAPGSGAPTSEGRYVPTGDMGPNWPNWLSFGPGWRSLFSAAPYASNLNLKYSWRLWVASYEFANIGQSWSEVLLGMPLTTPSFCAYLASNYANPTIHVQASASGGQPVGSWTGSSYSVRQQLGCAP